MSKHFPDVAGLLELFTRGKDGGDLSKLYDFENAPRPPTEIERKFDLLDTAGSEEIDRRLTRFMSKIGEIVEGRNLTLVGHTTFAGIDRYYPVDIRRPDGSRFQGTFRYRFGSNRPPQLSLKYQKKEGDNSNRGEFNADVSRADPDTMHAMLSAVCWAYFCVEQSGNFWKFRDEAGRAVEVVAYKVGRHGEGPSRLFAEIEAVDFEDASAAFEIIENVQKLLGFSRPHTQSVAEIFGPQRPGDTQ